MLEVQGPAGEVHEADGELPVADGVEGFDEDAVDVGGEVDFDAVLVEGEGAVFEDGGRLFSVDPDDDAVVAADAELGPLGGVERDLGIGLGGHVVAAAEGLDEADGAGGVGAVEPGPGVLLAVDGEGLIHIRDSVNDMALIPGLFAAEAERAGQPPAGDETGLPGGVEV